MLKRALLLLLGLSLGLNACKKKDDDKHAIEFRVTVPESTPSDDFIYVKVFGPNAFKMTQVEDRVYSFTMEVESGQDVYYSYARNNVGSQTVESTPLGPAGSSWDQIRYAKGKDEGQTLRDEVSSWRWLDEAVPAPPPSLAEVTTFVPRVNQEEFRSGVGMHDYWNDGFLELTDRAARHQLENSMKWVVLAVNPVVERSDDTSFVINYAPVGQYNETALREQIKIYRSHGVKVKLTATLQGSAIPENADEAYWDRRFTAYAEYVKWLGTLAESEGVSEVSLANSESLPGYSPSPLSNTDRWVQTVSGLRSVFSGEVSYIAYMGKGFDTLFPLEHILPILDQFDALGLIAWDTITTIDNPSVDDLQAEIAALFDQNIKTFWETYQKPIFIEQLAYASVEKGYNGDLYPADDRRTSTWDAPDPTVSTDLSIQANIFEAFLREVAARPYITGVYIFGQPYWKSIDRNYGVWGKPAESIIAGWYAKGL